MRKTRMMDDFNSKTGMIKTKWYRNFVDLRLNNFRCLHTIEGHAMKASVRTSWNRHKITLFHSLTHLSLISSHQTTNIRHQTYPVPLLLMPTSIIPRTKEISLNLHEKRRILQAKCLVFFGVDVWRCERNGKFGFLTVNESVIIFSTDDLISVIDKTSGLGQRLFARLVVNEKRERDELTCKNRLKRSRARRYKCE